LLARGRTKPTFLPLEAPFLGQKDPSKENDAGNCTNKKFSIPKKQYRGQTADFKYNHKIITLDKTIIKTYYLSIIKVKIKIIGDIMESVLASCSASISELKKNPSALIEQSGGEPIAILNHNKPTAYLVPAETYEALLEKIEDYQLGVLVRERQHEKISAVEVTLDEL